MKFIKLFLLFFASFLCFNADAQIKGSSICYFSNDLFTTTWTPNIAEDCEVALDISTTTLWCWNRTNTAWEKCNEASGSSTTVSNPDGTVTITTDDSNSSNFTPFKIWGTYVDHDSAGNNGVPVGGVYEIDWGSTIGMAGTLIRRKL